MAYADLKDESHDELIWKILMGEGEEFSDEEEEEEENCTWPSEASSIIMKDLRSAGFNLNIEDVSTCITKCYEIFKNHTQWVRFVFFSHSLLNVPHDLSSIIPTMSGFLNKISRPQFGSWANLSHYAFSA